MLLSGYVLTTLFTAFVRSSSVGSTPDLIGLEQNALNNPNAAARGSDPICSADLRRPDPAECLLAVLAVMSLDINHQAVVRPHDSRYYQMGMSRDRDLGSNQSYCSLRRCGNRVLVQLLTFNRVLSGHNSNT